MKTAQFDAGLLLGKQPNGCLITGWQAPSPFTPKEDPHYIFPSWAEDVVAWLVCAREPLYLFGPTGCGKTSCVKQLARRLRYAVYEVTGHSRLEFPDLVGHHTVQKGSMRYEYGPLSRAMREGGLFLLNEIDLLDPGTAAGLNAVLDGYPLTVVENGGELIVPHPLFRFAVTANSNGGSDQSGLYQGVLRQNIAFMDRFMLVKCGYMREDEELALLLGHVGEAISLETLQCMIRFANAVRRLFLGDDSEELDTSIEVTFSTRTLVRWAMLTRYYVSRPEIRDDAVAHALDRALGFRASPASRLTLAELRQRIFG